MLCAVTFIFVVSSFDVRASSDSASETIVGSSQCIECTAEVSFSGVESTSVLFEWFGPKGDPITNDSRVTISQAMAMIDTSSTLVTLTDTFVSILQFSYITEEDKGRYRCNVTILRTTESDVIRLTGFDGKT